MYRYIRKIDTPTLILAEGDFSNETAVPDGYEMIDGPIPDGLSVNVQMTPIQQLEALITEGQQEMAGDPLPKDIQKQIYDLEVFIQNYYKRGAVELIIDAIQAFNIDPSRTDVSQEQFTLVDQLKTKMLAVFSG